MNGLREETGGQENPETLLSDADLAQWRLLQPDIKKRMQVIGAIRDAGDFLKRLTSTATRWLFVAERLEDSNVVKTLLSKMLQTINGLRQRAGSTSTNWFALRSSRWSSYNRCK